MADGGLELGIDELSGFDEITSGGFSTVYAAWDEGFQRRVAVKVLHSLDADGRRRFDRERGIMGQLSAHPNVITPFRAGYTRGGAPYLVMEYVAGGSLDDRLRRDGKVRWAESLDIIIATTQALGYAHRLGVLHRDIKPGNILLAGPTPKLADFGIAAIRQSTATQVAYTLAHCPPETFADGQDNRDERSDLYSMASTLYTLLAGHAPFHVEGPDSQQAYMFRILELVPPPLPDDIPEPLRELVKSVLLKEPESRPATAGALIASLERVRYEVTTNDLADGDAGRAAHAAAETTLIDRADATKAQPPDSALTGSAPGVNPEVSAPDEQAPASSLGPQPWPAPSVSADATPPAEAPPSTPPTPKDGPGTWPAPSVSADATPRSGPPPLPSESAAPPASDADGGELRSASVSGEAAPVEATRTSVPQLIGAPEVNARQARRKDTESSASPWRMRALIAAAAAGVIIVGAFAANAIVNRGDGGGDIDGVGDDVAAPTAEDADTGDPGTEGADPPVGDDVVVTLVGFEASDLEIQGIQAALEPFTEETGITVDYTGPSDWRSAVDEAVAANEPPDISLFPQPATLLGFAEAGDVLPVPNAVATSVAVFWDDDWLDLTIRDGSLYGIPTRSELKSLVWYQPARFDDLGYELPTTWEELEALTRIAIRDGQTPWCVGLESGSESGWPFTDWVENIVLQSYGTDFYDQWVDGEVGFTDPAIVEAFDTVGDLWNIEGAVLGGPESVSTTRFDAGSRSLLDGDCLMMHQGSFLSGTFPGDTRFGDGSDDAVDVFHFPAAAGASTSARRDPVLTWGVYAGAFADRPEVWELMEYLGSPEYADARQAAQAEIIGPSAPSAYLSAANGIDLSLYSPFEQTLLERFNTDVRFDAADVMPAPVGTGGGAFSTVGIDFADGELDAEEATAAIDSQWPASGP